MTTDAEAGLHRAGLADDGTPEGRRIIELLWNPGGQVHGGRGPKPRLHLEDIVRAGMEIADAGGLEQLSMRKVAAALDSGAMSLYTYVPGRAELIELMIDAAYAEHGRADPTRPWRERLEYLIRQTWALFARHPWVLDHNQARLPVGPNVLDVEESLYATIAAAGFSGADNVAVANFVNWQLLGAGRALIGDQVETRHTGVSAEEYWRARASFWTTYFDGRRYPTMLAIWESGGFDDDRASSLDGIITRLIDAIDRARPA